jgi:hypothetical protein
MILALLLSADGSERLRANDASCARSSSQSTNAAFGLPLAIALSPLGKIPQALQYLCKI